jgi:hypothetical protein
MQPSKLEVDEQGYPFMAALHYGLSQVGHEWVLTCESVPVECFDSYAEALVAAKTHIATAKKRGDLATLQLDDKGASSA